MPSSSGMRMSEMTSGASPMRSSTPSASRPVPASKQVNPCAWSIRTSERRTLGSSSTIRQLAAPAMMGGVLDSSGMYADQSAVGDGCHEHPFACRLPSWRAECPSGRCHRSTSAYRFRGDIPTKERRWPGVQARVRSEHQRKYPDLSASVWYDVAPIFPGVTQRMVNMAGERLTRLSTPRGFLILRADHLEFRPVPEGEPARRCRVDRLAEVRGGAGGAPRRASPGPFAPAPPGRTASAGTAPPVPAIPAG